MAANPATECATSWVRSSGKSKAKVVALTKDVALSASWDSVSMLRIDTSAVGSCVFVGHRCWILFCAVESIPKGEVISETGCGLVERRGQVGRSA